MQLHWLQAAVIFLQVGGMYLLPLTNLIATVRPIVIVAFLFFCPGMIAVRFLKLHEPLIEFVLALALSLTIDACLAGICLYAGWWWPETILNVLIGLCLAGILARWLGKSPQKRTNLATFKKLLTKPLDRTRGE